VPELALGYQNRSEENYIASRNPLCWLFEHRSDIVVPMATYQSLGEESSVSPHCFPETLGAHIPNVL